MGFLVPDPPPAASRTAELAYMHQVQDARTPGMTARATWLDEHGSSGGLWTSEAALARQRLGFAKGWLATGAMYVAMGVDALIMKVNKSHFDQPRPFELDPTITVIGPQPSDSSYPSGHAATSEAAATVLANFDPAHRDEYESFAAEVRAARVYSGVHFPSDVAAGAALGARVGNWFS